MMQLSVFHPHSHRSARPQALRCLVLLPALFTLAGCAAQTAGERWQNANHPAPVATDVSECAALLAVPVPPYLQRVDRSEISLMVWNTQKAEGEDWRFAVSELSRDHDLVLLQEFTLGDPWPGDGYLSFSPGYRSATRQTGVVMLSRSEPLAVCELAGTEPVLRTPKATAIARFPLDDERTLVVVNLHAVNFALGLKNFSAQIRDAADAVAGHTGPLIFSGDFNTWRGKRLQLVQQQLAALGLEPVSFLEDRRKRVFGQPLDHIYVRGLEVIDATTSETANSDHNPMFVRLRT